MNRHEHHCDECGHVQDGGTTIKAPVTPHPCPECGGTVFTRKVRVNANE